MLPLLDAYARDTNPFDNEDGTSFKATSAKVFLPKLEVEDDRTESVEVEYSICMDEVQTGGNFLVLPCQHRFHAECIDAWLSESNTCPHCRQRTFIPTVSSQPLVQETA